MNAAERPSGVRLAELVAALSLATDLGLGQPQEHVLRQTVIARRLAAAAGLPGDQRAAVFYVSLPMRRDAGRGTTHPWIVWGHRSGRATWGNGRGTPTRYGHPWQTLHTQGEKR